MKQLTDEQRELIMRHLSLADEMVNQLKDLPECEKEDFKSIAIVSLCESALDFEQSKEDLFLKIARDKIKKTLAKELKKLELR